MIRSQAEGLAAKPAHKMKGDFTMTKNEAMAALLELMGDQFEMAKVHPEDTKHFSETHEKLVAIYMTMNSLEEA